MLMMTTVVVHVTMVSRQTQFRIWPTEILENDET